MNLGQDVICYVLYNNSFFHEGICSKKISGFINQRAAGTDGNLEKGRVYHPKQDSYTLIRLRSLRIILKFRSKLTCFSFCILEESKLTLFQLATGQQPVWPPISKTGWKSTPQVSLSRIKILGIYVPLDGYSTSKRGKTFRVQCAYLVIKR